MTNYAQTERAALADLLDEVGPEAQTLCGDWTTADLAAHLVIRERRPDAAVGILLPALSGRSERIRVDTRDGLPWPQLVDEVRNGPPRLMRPLDGSINTVEYFVHHEDVRRAAGQDREPRTLDGGQERALWSRLKLTARLMARSAPVGMEVVSPGYGRCTAKKGTPTVTVEGAPGELMLFAFGRQVHARVELAGDDVSMSRLREASLGL